MGGSGSDDDVRVASSGPSSCTSHHAGSWTTKRLEPERSRKANKEYFYNNLVKRKQQQSTKSEYHSSIPTAVSGNSLEDLFTFPNEKPASNFIATNLHFSRCDPNCFFQQQVSLL